MIFTIQLSLRQKITLGHGLIAIIIIILSVFTYIELRFLEKKLVSGEKIAEFFDTALELRRFEKNYFLYKQRSDYEENQVYIAKLLAMIENNHNDLVILLTESALTQLVQKITQYQYLMTHIDKSNRPLIRDIGKNIVTIAEKVAKTERELLKESLRHSINTFLLAIVLLSIFGIVIGRILSHLVVRPLRLMEENMDKIATGHFKKLQVPSNEREIRSLEAAFNHMLNALETQQRHLLQSEKLAALGTLLSGVAHELNNPLSNISSSCQILLEELDEVDINYFRELLTQIDIQTIRAQRIVYALLEFSRKKDFKKEHIPLNKLVQETLHFIQGQVPTGVSVKVDIPEEIVIFVDKQRMQQVLLNLLKNAVQAVGNQGTISLCAHKSQTINIEISDTGSGISAEQLPKIFDPFFTTKEVGQGSGLGLSIVYEIIEEHEGEIQAKSHLGQGTTFLIRLPIGT